MSLICAAAGALIVSGCRSADEGGSAEVVATTTQLADIAQNAAGDEAEVHGILPANADPHDYEPRPSDTTALAGAELVLTSGGEVDAWIDELIESSGTDARVVTLLDAVPVTRTDRGETDPHWWHDPHNAIAAARAIGDELAAADPANASSYERNATDYVRTLTQLDRSIADCIGLVPKSARKLVTAHDSLGYFADRYGIEVVGAAVPALSTQAQPSSGETAELVDLIRESGVRAVFPEAGLPGELEAAIASEAGVGVGGELYADSLGEDGTAGATYAGALAANASALVEALSDGARDCGSLEVE